MDALRQESGQARSTPPLFCLVLVTCLLLTQSCVPGADMLSARVQTFLDSRPDNAQPSAIFASRRQCRAAPMPFDVAAKN